MRNMLLIRISFTCCLLILFNLSAVYARKNKGFLPSVRWTPWYNYDQPDGVGDMETLSTLRELRGSELCENPLHIQVKTKDGILARDTDQIVHYSPSDGFWCLNEDQANSECLDYKVRFLCPDVLPETKDNISKEENNSNGSIPNPWQDVLDKSSETWSEWSQWSACDITCGGVGSQERKKICDGGDRMCSSKEIVESKPCGDNPCINNLKKCDTSGVVTDKDDIPLQGVNIGLGKAGNFILLTKTDKGGRFHVDGICADSGSAHLVARKRNYISTRIHSKVNGSGNAVSTVRLLDAEFPAVFVHPNDKVRLVGQSVKFCCKARGTYKNQRFSWYHNGTLVDASLFSRDPRNLEISNLQLNDAGTYYCQVQSLTTPSNDMDVSHTALLTVFREEITACPETPMDSYVELPRGCKTGENRTHVNVGECSSQMCPDTHLTSSGCDEETAGKCCNPVEYSSEIVNCGDYRFEMSKVSRCGCCHCIKPVTKIEGKAYGDNTSDPLTYGSIYRGKEKIGETTYDGSFSVEVPQKAKRLVLTFEDRFGKFVSTTKVLTLEKEGGVTFHKVKMPRKSPEQVFSSVAGSIIPLSTGNESFAEIVTEANSFYNKDGKPYSGKVKASVTFIDPSNDKSYEETSTGLSYVNQGGKVLPMTTYGMFELDYRDNEGNALNVGRVKLLLDGTKIPDLGSSESMKLWSLNKENGMWEVEDDLQTSQVQFKYEGNSNRVKREDRTFLVGNLEFRERQLFNLNAPSENKCWMKVRAYRSSKFDPEQQVEGVAITAINMVSKPEFKFNPRSWGRYDTKLTNKNGACVRVFCDDIIIDAYKATVKATLDETEELFAAPSTYPQTAEMVGVRQSILNTLQYQRSDHNEVTGKKTSFQTNLPKPPTGSKLTGPIYPNENLKDCQAAEVTDDHFRFYRTEDFLYEFNSVYMDEHNCVTWTPNYLNWWPYPQNFTACYMKILIEGNEGAVVRVKSFGGTHPRTKGKLYGIRDDKTVKSTEDVLAACVEFKCSGKLYDSKMSDRTLVFVVPQGDYELFKVNKKLSQYLINHPPGIKGNRGSNFKMFAPMDALDHNYGIYTATDVDPLIAKKSAIGKCYAGSSTATSRIMHPRKGVALHYRPFIWFWEPETELP